MENKEILEAMDMLARAFNALSRIKDKSTTDYLLATARGLVKLNNLPVKLQNKFYGASDVNKDIKEIIPLLYNFAGMTTAELTQFININYKERSFFSKIDAHLNRTAQITTIVSLFFYVQAYLANDETKATMQMQIEKQEQIQQEIQELKALELAQIKQQTAMNSRQPDQSSETPSSSQKRTGDEKSSEK